MTPRKVRIDLIDESVYTQARAHTNDVTVAEYRERLEAGDELPAIVLFKTQDGRFIIADGWHRYYAHKALEREEILAVVQLGTEVDARLYATSANIKHGLPRTAADKRVAVEIVLKLCPKWPTRRVADFVKVSNSFVHTIQQEKDLTSDDVSQAVRGEQLTESQASQGDTERVFQYGPEGEGADGDQGEPEETVEGRDGKAHPKRKKKDPKPSQRSKQGKEKVSAKERIACRDHFGKFVRLLGNTKTADAKQSLFDLVTDELDGIATKLAKEWDAKK